MIMPLISGYSSSEDDTEQNDNETALQAHTSVDKSAAVSNMEDVGLRKRESDFKRMAKELKKRRKGGPWGEYIEETEAAEENGSDIENKEVPVEGTKELNLDLVVTLDKDLPPSQDEYSDSDSEVPRFHSEFLGKETSDYLNRSFMHPPYFTKAKENFCPKKVLYTLPGHAKGITKLEFFPSSGHLLLSSGNDCEIRLWNTSTQELLRIYHGHDKAVKDIVFNSTGSHFISCGYDKRVQLWNTETGEISKTVIVPSFPHCLCFHPNDKEFIVGLANHNIQHYSINGELLQSYTHHLGSITSLTIIDSGSRFMSTADDKSVRMWDWQIDIPVKCISDPVQHAMPNAAVHPVESYIALQGMDNIVHVIRASCKYKFNRQKTFKGHNVTGHGVQIDISPDGKILMSGDSHGYVYFWDWKSTRVVRKLKLSDKLVSCIRFHPAESSKVVAGGISGEIYYCD